MIPYANARRLRDRFVSWAGGGYVAKLGKIAKKTLTKKKSNMTDVHMRSQSRGRSRHRLPLTPKHTPKKSKSAKPRSRSRSKGKAVVKKHSPLAADTMHSGFTVDTVVVRRKGIKYEKYHSKMPQWAYQWSFQGKTTVASGQQVVQDLIQIGTAKQFTQNAGIPMVNFDVSPVAWYDLNPNSLITGSAYYGTQTPSNDEIILKSYESRWMLTSESGLAQVMTFYVCTPKCVTQRLPGRVWSDSVITDEGQNKAAQTFPSAGFAAFGTSGSESTLNLFAKPTDYQRFRSEWRIVATKTLRLEGNSTEMINFDFKIHKKIKKSKLLDLLNQAGGPNIFLPGITHSIMVVTHGVPCIDQTVPAGHLVTTGSPTVAYIYSQKVHLHGVPSHSDRIATLNAYSQIPALVSSANQGMLNETDTPGTVQGFSAT